MKINNVAIFGGAETSQNSKLFSEVEETARILAKSGYKILNGGGPGVMLAATEGAESVDGDTMAVILEAKDAPGFEKDKKQENKPDFSIRTSHYLDRMKGLIDNSDAFVVFNGGTGTLSEFSTVWCMARIYYGHNKPIILYGDFWEEIIETITKNMYIRPVELKVIKMVNSPEEVMQTIKEYTKK